AARRRNSRTNQSHSSGFSMRTVAIAIFPGVQALDVAGPVDVFAEANAFVDSDAGYVTTLVGATTDALRASNGMRMAADLSFDEAGERARAKPFHTALVAGGPGLPDAAPEPRLTR